MEVKLIKDRLFLRKVADSYTLHRIKDNILTIEGDSQYTIGGIDPFYKLSKQNCDSIFGVVDVEKLAKEETRKYLPGCPENIMNFIAHERFFKIAFEQAMELNKDKVFTLEDVILIAEYVRVASQSTPNERTKNLVDEYLSTQPTEINVEIMMSNIYVVPEPLIDSKNCLILKKI